MLMIWQSLIEKLPFISGTGNHPVFDLMTSQESMRDSSDYFIEAVELKGRIECCGWYGCVREGVCGGA